MTRPGFRDFSAWIFRKEELFLFALIILGLVLCWQAGGKLAVVPLFVAYLRFICAQGLVLCLVFAVFSLAFKRGTRSFSEGPKATIDAFFGQRCSVTECVTTFGEFLRGIIIFSLALSVYTNLKVRIPLIHATVGDALFAQLDAALFGSLPQWLESWTRQHETVANWLGDVYLGGYKGIVVLAIFMVIRFEPRQLRVLFLAMALTYLASILVTILYPSLGPCFVDVDRFHWLAGSEIGDHQRMLFELRAGVLENARRGVEFSPEPFAGIAAFPSLHVGNLFVVLLLSVRYCRIAFPFIAYYLLGTCLSATAFGWHYVVDYLGGALIAIAVTWVVEATVPKPTAESNPVE